VQRRLSRGSLPLASGDDVAHDDLVNVSHVNACAVDRLADSDGAKLGRGEPGERTEEAPDGGADGADEDGIAVGHWFGSFAHKATRSIACHSKCWMMWRTRQNATTSAYLPGIISYWGR
jgi:hypothetical protein